jgi:hypothetical protein
LFNTQLTVATPTVVLEQAGAKGIEGKTADIVGYHPGKGRWLIAESKWVWLSKTTPALMCRLKQ